MLTAPMRPPGKQRSPAKRPSPARAKASAPRAGRSRSSDLRRYVAFLRGVSPMNAKMPDLVRSFEAARFSEVKTVLSSGNVVFSAPRASEITLAKRAEAAMQAELGHGFPVIVRSVDALRALLESDPFSSFRLARDAKRVVTFLKRPPKAKLSTPIEFEAARILCANDSHVFAAYVPGPRGPVFMRLIEKTFGKDVTTRTWDTVRKVAK
jgi:uncharacterized protein (DUF1697 family)